MNRFQRRRHAERRRDEIVAARDVRRDLAREAEMLSKEASDVRAGRRLLSVEKVSQMVAGDRWRASNRDRLIKDVKKRLPKAEAEEAIKQIEYNARTAETLRTYWRANAEILHPVIAAYPDRLLSDMPKSEFANRDAIVVGAGPSLDDVIEDVGAAYADGTTDIWATDAALWPLMKNGIIPAGVVCVDAQPAIMQYFVAPDADGKMVQFRVPAGTRLVCANISYPEIVKSFREEDIWFCGFRAGDPSWDDLAAINLGSPVPLPLIPAQGNVTSVTAMLCEILNYRRIAIAGFDLSYGGGRYYCNNILGPNSGKALPPEANEKLRVLIGVRPGTQVPVDAVTFGMGEHGLHSQTLFAARAARALGDGSSAASWVWSDPNMMEYARQMNRAAELLGWNDADRHVMILGQTIVNPTKIMVGTIATGARLDRLREAVASGVSGVIEAPMRRSAVKANA